MKKNLSLLFVAFALILHSCSSGNEKEITAISNEFISGDLAELVEFTDEPCKIIYVEKDGVMPSQVFRLTVQMKLKKESPDLQKMEPQDIDFTSLLSVAVVNLIDENGIKIQDLSILTDDLLKLKKLLQGKEGDTAEIVFQEDFHNQDDAPGWFEQVAKFTPYLSADIAGLAKEIGGSYTLKGSVHTYPITMNIDIDGTQVKGNYYYDRMGPGATLKLSGTIENGIMDINETDEKGVPAGHFKGNFVNGVYTGEFITNKGEKMPFSVSESGDVTVSDEITSDVETSEMAENGSADFDEFLDRYEEYVDQYILLLKKADKGDMAALAEYPALLEKAQDLQGTIKSNSSNLTSSQLSRYNRINEKMMIAIESMSNE